MSRIRISIILLIIAARTIAFAAEPKAAPRLVDYFLPIEPRGPLVSEGIWGDAAVLPRDPLNGLEDAKMESWCYWDGMILKGDDGRYHMFGSRWGQEVPHSKGWNQNSKAMHAVSDHPLGPYRDEGMTWPHWREGAGHNVMALKMHDGRYAAVTSEVTEGEVFVADSPDGPWEFHGKIEIDPNGFNPDLARYGPSNQGAVRAGTVGHMANVMILLRPDGRYMIIPRSTAPMVSDYGILGPYKIMNTRVYDNIPELPQEKMEDPTVWYSGGLYHIVLNHHPTNISYHLTSKDGIGGWRNRGIAFSREAEIFKYTDGTLNRWKTVQRPIVFVQGGHPTHFTFSVVDVSKGEDRGSDNHGSKIVVVPFDGAAFDRDLAEGD